MSNRKAANDLQLLAKRLLKTTASNIKGSSGGSSTDLTPVYAAIDLKANASHTHSIGDVTNLTTSLSGKADSVHTHAISDVTNLATSLSGKADSVHTHTLSSLTQSGAALNQVPQWSGSAWVPATVSGGSSPSNVDGGNASSIPVVGLTYDGGSA
jgi:hypothetical protein